jgi:hypothetical protein
MGGGSPGGHVAAALQGPCLLRATRPHTRAGLTVSPPASAVPSLTVASVNVTVLAPAAKNAVPLPLAPLPVMLEPEGTEAAEKSVLQVGAPVKVKATLTPPVGAAEESLKTMLLLPLS